MNVTVLAFLLLALAIIVFIAERTRGSQLRKKLREEKRVTEHLEEIDRLRGDLVATITHQLKTPLTSLLGYATLLRRRADSLTEEQRQQWIVVIEQQAEKIMHLIEELLASARVEKGAGLQRVPLDVAAIARALADEFSTARGRTVDVDAPAEDLGLFGDRDAIEHIIGNLLDNAVKYSAADTAVRIAIWEGDGEVLTSVTDDGVGIPPDELPHIFERFRQVDGGRGRGSVGLGLYIVRNLVSAHGGRVWAESEPGKGTTVTFSLPRRRRDG